MHDKNLSTATWYILDERKGIFSNNTKLTLRSIMMVSCDVFMNNIYGLCINGVVTWAAGAVIEKFVEQASQRKIDIMKDDERNPLNN